MVDISSLLRFFRLNCFFKNEESGDKRQAVAAASSHPDENDSNAYYSVTETPGWKLGAKAARDGCRNTVADFQFAVSWISNPQAPEGADGLPTGSRRYSRLATCATTAADAPLAIRERNHQTTPIQSIISTHHDMLIINLQKRERFIILAAV
jgi:hypothetical protein